MTKAVSISLGLILILAGPSLLPAQTNSAANIAITQAVWRQANTIVLRQKLVQAKDAVARGDLTAAAQLYEDAYRLVQQIGSGIPDETAQTISGLVSVRLELAREAQDASDWQGASLQAARALKVAPNNPAVIAFNKQLEQKIHSLQGKIPDVQTLQEVPNIAKEKTQADTLVRDGKLLYEMGKFEEAQAKLEQALKLDPANRGAIYYLNLVKQGMASRSEGLRSLDDQTRIVEVTKAWESPKRNEVQLPVPNPYATNTLIHTGPGREVIMDKLNRIRLNKVFYDGLPLSEVVRDLSEQAKLRDPDKVGINFLINPNPDLSASVTTYAPATGAGGPGYPGGYPAGGAPGQAGFQGGQGGGQQPQINPTTGLPINNTATSGASQPVDINQVIIRINPPLYNIRLADALDAIVQVADHPIEYSINDYAVVFSAKGPNSPQLYSRTFRIDANTFVQGLESVGSLAFYNNNNTGSTGGTGGTTSGGGGTSGNGQNSSVGLVAIVNAAPGEAGYRSSGTGGGGGGYGGGGGGVGQGGQGYGGLSFVTQTNATVDVSLTAKNFFTTLGVDLNPPKSIFFNDRLGLLFVRATMQDLDTIESAIEALNQVAPEVHIKTRFIQVEQDDNEGLGFDWYLGQFSIGGGNVVAQGGSAPSLNVPGPNGSVVPFPGPTAANQVAPSASDQQITSGLGSSGIPTIGTITGILTDPNFRLVIHALQQRKGYDELAEPEVTTISGRQTEMKATVIQTIETGFSFQQGTPSTTTGTAVP